MSKKITDLPLITSLAPTDRLLVSEASSGLSVAIEGSNIAQDSDPNLLFQWNGIDVKQFQNNGIPSLDDGAQGVLTRVIGRFNQPVLRVTAQAAAGKSQWAIKAAELPAVLPSRYILDFEIDQMSDGAGGFNVGDQCGFSHFCQFNAPGDVLAYSLLQYGNINNYLQLWTRNTTFANSGTTPIGRGPGNGSDRGVRHIVEVMQDLSGTYDINLRSRFEGQASVSYYTNNDATNLDLDAGAFDGEVPNTFGLAAAFVAINHFIDISVFRILKHPADA